MPPWLAEAGHHLPKIRLADSLIGGGLGLGLGAGVYGLRRALSDEPDELSLPGHLAAGGLLGVGAGNLAGDRMRRYIANNALPSGYGSVSQYEMLAPKGLEHIWQTAVLDRPSQAVQEAATANAATMPELSPFVLRARQELLRRGMGLPVRQGEEVFRSLGNRPFQPTPRVPHPDFPTLSLDPGSGGVPGNYETFEFDPAALQQAIKTKDPGAQAMLDRLSKRWQWEQRQAKDPRPRALPPNAQITNPAGPFLARHGTKADLDKGQMTVSDLWDFALTPGEEDQLAHYVGSLATNPGSLSDPVPDYVSKADPWIGEWDEVQGLGGAVPGAEIEAPNPHTGIPDTYRVPTGWEHLKLLAMRKLFNDWLLDNGGVAVNQQFDMRGAEPVPTFQGSHYDLGRQAGGW